MGLWGRNGVVGLELDTGMLRAVEIRGNGRKPHVVAAGQLRVPEDAVSDGVVRDVDTVGKALEKLWQKARLGSRRVVLGVFNQSVLMRMITFPRLPQEKLRQALRLQAGEYLPIPVSQMVLDFAVVGETYVDDEPMTEVLLVAARKQQLETSLQALQYSRLTPVVVDASPLALLRVLPPEKRQGTIAMVDLAMGMSSIVLAVDGMPRFARVLPVSLQQYLSGLGVQAAGDGEYSGLVAAAAESGMAEDGHVRQWSSMVAREIRTSVSFYIRQEDLQLPVEVAVPQAAVSVRRKMSADLSQPEFAVSLGLALRGLEV